MAFPVAQVIGGIGALASVFGKKKPAQSPYEKQQLAMLRQQQGIAGQNQMYAGQARQRYNGLQTQATGAMTGLASLLRQNPFTDSFRAQRLGNMNEGVNRLYDRNRMNVQRSAVRAGVSPDSTYAQQGLANVDADRAAAKSAGYLQLTQDEMANRQGRAEQLNALYGNAAGQAQNDAQGYLQTAMGGLGSVGGQCGNLMQYDDARNAAWDQEQGQDIGQLAQMLAGLTQRNRKFGGVRMNEAGTFPR